MTLSSASAARDLAGYKPLTAPYFRECEVETEYKASCRRGEGFELRVLALT